MRKFKDKINRKLKSRAGMSLLEVLCAVLILLLVSVGMTSAVTLAANQYQKSLRNSEAQVLFSTLRTVLSHELAYTSYIENDPNLGVIILPPSIPLDYSYGAITTDDSGEKGYGQIVFANPNDSTERNFVLSKAAYTKGLLAKVTSITYSNTTHYFTVYLSIGYNGTEYYGGEFQVKNVNETTATVADGS